MKKICIIMTNLIAAEEYRDQLLQVFGNSIVVDILSFKNYSKDLVRDVDLFLLHNNYITKEINTHIELPMGIPIVDIRLDFDRKNISLLKNYKPGTKCIFISASQGFTNEGISRLHQLGVYNIEWIPYSEENVFFAVADFAITPGEMQNVPQRIKDKYKVLDFGRRKLSPSVIDEIAVSFNMEYIFEWSNYKNYINQFVQSNKGNENVAEDNFNVNNGIKALGNIISEGVITINEFGKIICFNQRVAEILNVVKEDAIGQVIWEYNEELFGWLREYFDIGGIVEQVERTHQKRKLDIKVYPLASSDKYRGNFILISSQKKERIFKQVDNMGHTGKYVFRDIVGKGISEIIELAKKMVKIDASILIEGETGTGKEMFASAIHNASERKNYPFVAINCSALPDSLLESEIFGYEEGAFTGARKRGKIGLFELANGGTLFLDEIEDMNSRMQSALLRAIQEKQIMRVGGNKLIDIDVRVIASSNIDLRKLKDEGKFRKDLYYRLSPLLLKLPPLRERIDDIDELIHAYLSSHNYDYKFSNDMIRFLKSLEWEGNVRQLYNSLEFFACLDKPVIEVEDYPYPRNLCEEKQKDINMFVLELLYGANMRETSIGRKAIMEKAKVNGIHITETRIRKALKQLELEGLVEVHKGRGGSRISQLGIEKIKI